MSKKYIVVSDNDGIIEKYDSYEAALEAAKKQIRIEADCGYQTDGLTIAEIKAEFVYSGKWKEY